MSKEDASSRGGASEEPAPGLRERKAAATRLALVRALSARLRRRSLAEITADELAEDVGVSRVTFFNYFANKEAALELVLVVWLYERQCETAARRRRGLAALEGLFQSMGAFVQEGPLRARQILAWFVAMPLDRPPPVLTRADREAIAGEGAPTPDPWLLGEMLQIHLAEARDAGEVALTSGEYEMAHLLGALLIGGCLVGHSRPKQDWERLYRHHLRRALNLDVAAKKKAAARGRAR